MTDSEIIERWEKGLPNNGCGLGPHCPMVVRPESYCIDCHSAAMNALIRERQRRRLEAVQ